VSESERPELAELSIADPPERWEALGFAIEDARAQVGGLQLRFGVGGRGISAWSIHNIGDPGTIDGLPTTRAKSPSPKKSVPHPNRATGIDHVVVVTPDFDRTAAELARTGMPLRRVRDGGRAFARAFVASDRRSWSSSRRKTRRPVPRDSGDWW
jgi:hypothetical protein